MTSAGLDRTLDPELVAAFRRLRGDLQPGEDVSDLVSKNINLTFCWDGAGVEIVADDECPPLATDFPMQINGWTIAGKRSETGSAVFTVYAGLYADYPVPVSIVASANPTVSSAAKAIGDVAAVSTWDRIIPRGAVFVANPDSISGFTKVTLSLRARRLDL